MNSENTASPMSVADPLPHNNEENYAIHVANRKVRINFHHGGIYCFLPNDRQKINSLLDKVMRYYGFVKDAWYHEEFLFGYVTFATHDQAQAALFGLKDESSLRIILNDVSETLGKDTQSIDFLTRLFFTPGEVGLCVPSWASPKSRGRSVSFGVDFGEF